MSVDLQSKSWNWSYKLGSFNEQLKLQRPEIVQ